MVHHRKYLLLMEPKHLQSLKLLLPKVKEEIHLQESTFFDLNQYPLHHMTYAPAKFEVAMSNGLGGNAFTRNILFELDLGSRSHEALPSISLALCTCKV